MWIDSTRPARSIRHGPPAKFFSSRKGTHRDEESSRDRNMFGKLRKSFLVLNLVIISVMMMGAFAAIYVVTHANIRSEIDMELRRLSDDTRFPGADTRVPFSGDESQDSMPTHGRRPDSRFSPEQSGPQTDGQPVPPDPTDVPERSVTFSVVTDTDGNIMQRSSPFEVDDSFYERAVAAALKTGKTTGRFRLEDSHWAFIAGTGPSGSRISFLDITARQNILTRLIYTFLVAGAVMFVLIYFLSRFFADRAIAPIREAFERQQLFVADASHELKTPLAVINSNIDVLLSGGEESSEDRAKWLRYIKAESERMTGLTNDLLYLTRLDFSESRSERKIVRLSEMIESVILTMEAVFFERKVSLNYDIGEGLSVRGNGEELRRVAMVLVDNALKYAGQNGSVDVSLRKKHHMVVLSVSNTGEGIEEKDLDHIFDRFYRADSSRSKKGGYGLGLSIARTIVDRHQGRISAASVPGVKTVFTVELPA